MSASEGLVRGTELAKLRDERGLLALTLATKGLRPSPVLTSQELLAQTLETDLQPLNGQGLPWPAVRKKVLQLLHSLHHSPPTTQGQIQI